MKPAWHIPSGVLIVTSVSMIPAGCAAAEEAATADTAPAARVAAKSRRVRAPSSISSVFIMHSPDQVGAPNLPCGYAGDQPFPAAEKGSGGATTPPAASA